MNEEFWYHLLAHQFLRPVDLALANRLRILDPSTPAMVMAAAALASFAVANGHVGFDCRNPHALCSTAIDWPSFDTWRHVLADSPWVDTPQTPHVTAQLHCPIVFENDVIYLRRYREYERQLSLSIVSMAHDSRDFKAVAEDPLLMTLCHQLFAPQAVNTNQHLSALLALRHRLLIITGGPGTGKTTTVYRLLLFVIACEFAIYRRFPRIAVAAPTGRAAERMISHFNRASDQSKESQVVATLLTALPQTAFTLHRLLAIRHGATITPYHQDNPLPYDVIVIDEASMIDLVAMHSLVQAIHPKTQLILLGDPDQLPSIDVGNVFVSFLSQAGSGQGVTQADAQVFGSLLPLQTAIVPKTGPLCAVHIHFQHTYRQQSCLELAPLADAVRTGNITTALSLLRPGHLQGIDFVQKPLNLADQPQHPYLHHWRQLQHVTEPDQGLELLGKYCLLTPLRDGPDGVSALNRQITALLRQSQPTSDQGYFQGQIILITENSYELGLYNGDLGICLEDTHQVIWVWFAGKEGARRLSPATLPMHETAFAMTIHKAQGSEFDNVWLRFPKHDHPAITRQLLYTGMTRARQSLTLNLSERQLRSALQHHTTRMSGLSWRLAADAQSSQHVQEAQRSP